MKGRPRKPTAQLEASGAFEINPQRKKAREDEPESNGPIGDPPEYFDANHRAAWAELISIAADGVLAKSDRIHLELSVRLLIKMRLVPGRMPKWISFLGKALQTLGMPEHDVAEMKDAMRAALGINGQELALLQATLTRMGMTPADRSRVHGNKTKQSEGDPFEEAMRKLGVVTPIR